MKRRILAAVMAVILAVTMLPADVYAGAGNVETPDSVAVVQEYEGARLYFDTLEEAVEEASIKNAQVTVIRDVYLNQPLEINGNISLSLEANIFSTAERAGIIIDGEVYISGNGSDKKIICLSDETSAGTSEVIRVENGDVSITDLIIKNEDRSAYAIKSVNNSSVTTNWIEIYGKVSLCKTDNVFGSYISGGVYHDGVMSESNILDVIYNGDYVQKLTDAGFVNMDVKELYSLTEIEGEIKVSDKVYYTNTSNIQDYTLYEGVVDASVEVQGGLESSEEMLWYLCNNGNMQKFETATPTNIQIDVSKLNKGENTFLCVVSDGTVSVVIERMTITKPAGGSLHNLTLDGQDFEYNGIRYTLKVGRPGEGKVITGNGTMQFKAGEKISYCYDAVGTITESKSMVEEIDMIYSDGKVEELAGLGYSAKKGQVIDRLSDISSEKDAHSFIMPAGDVSIVLRVNSNTESSHVIEDAVYNGNGTHTGKCTVCGEMITEECSCEWKTQCATCKQKCVAMVEDDVEFAQNRQYYVTLEQAFEALKEDWIGDVVNPKITLTETGGFEKEEYNLNNSVLSGNYVLDLNGNRVNADNLTVGSDKMSDIKIENGTLSTNENNIKVKRNSVLTIGENLQIDGSIECDGRLIDINKSEDHLSIICGGNSKIFVSSNVYLERSAGAEVYFSAEHSDRAYLSGNVYRINDIDFVKENTDVRVDGVYCGYERKPVSWSDFPEYNQIYDGTFTMPENSIKILDHDLFKVNATEDTEAYYECRNCSKHFKDSSGMEEIPDGVVKKKCEISNRPYGGYPSEFSYSGAKITDPAESNFLISNTDQDRKIEFVWRKNGEILNTAPSQTGEYTLTVIVYETEHFSRGEYTMKVTVKPVTPAGKVIVSYIDKNSNGILDTGDQLYADTSGIRPAPQSVKVDWLIKNGSDLRKLEADSSGRYTVKAYDKGEIFCVVRCEGSVAGSITSENRLILNKKNLKGDIHILGNPVYGNTLMITRPDEGILNKDYTVQWYCDGAAIFGENRETYVVRKSDEGKHLYARLVATENGNFTGILTSSQVTVAIRDVKPETPEITSFKTDFGKIRVYFQRVPSVQDKTMHYEISYKNLYGGSTSWRYATVGYNYLTLNNLVKNGKYEIKVRTYYWTDGRQKMHSEWSDGKIVYANRIGSSGQIMYKAGFTKVQAGNTSIKMNIKKVAFTKNPVRITYQIAYRKDKGSRYTGFKYVYTNNLNKTIYNLSRKTLYQVKIRYYYRSKVDNKLVFSDYTRIRFVKTR